MDRIPFSDAISDEKLLKRAFQKLSWPQQVALKAFYGCALSHKRGNIETGFSELDYWAILQGACTYDELGFVTKVFEIPYEPKEYEQLWGLCGRRGGKTSQLLSFSMAYEAALGGHEEYIQPDQDCTMYLIAHRMDLATATLPFVRHVLNSSPLIAKQVIKDVAGRIELKNGISITPSPPSLKAQRGFAVPMVGMDEVGFWYTDKEAANPDVEVERAVKYAQLQFPHRKMIGISTPWTKEGLLWDYYMAGTGGIKKDTGDKEKYEDVLVIFAPTAVLENPALTGGKWNPSKARKELQKIRNSDPEAFTRESLCQFLDSVSGYLSPVLINIAAQKAKGIAERPPFNEEAERKKKQDQNLRSLTIPNYVAAMDPAFKRDSFAFTIVHRDLEKGIVVDVLKRWTPARTEKLNPKEVIALIADLCKSYKIDLIYADQYQFESLQQIALEFGLVMDEVKFSSISKARIYGSLQQYINQQKLELLDPALNEAAKTTVEELIKLERRNLPNGGVQIGAPEGHHDDMPTVLAIAAFKANWMEPTVEAEPDIPPEPTLYERGMATIKKMQASEHQDW